MKNRRKPEESWKSFSGVLPSGITPLARSMPMPNQNLDRRSFSGTNRDTSRTIVKICRKVVPNRQAAHPQRQTGPDGCKLVPPVTSTKLQRPRRIKRRAAPCTPQENPARTSGIPLFVPAFTGKNKGIGQALSVPGPGDRQRQSCNCLFAFVLRPRAGVCAQIHSREVELSCPGTVPKSPCLLCCAKLAFLCAELAGRVAPRRIRLTQSQTICPGVHDPARAPKWRNTSSTCGL